VEIKQQNLNKENNNNNSQCFSKNENYSSSPILTRGQKRKSTDPPTSFLSTFNDSIDASIEPKKQLKSSALNNSLSSSSIHPLLNSSHDSIFRRSSMIDITTRSGTKTITTNATTTVVPVTGKGENSNPPNGGVKQPLKAWNGNSMTTNGNINSMNGKGGNNTGSLTSREIRPNTMTTAEMKKTIERFKQNQYQPGKKIITPTTTANTIINSSSAAIKPTSNSIANSTSASSSASGSASASSALPSPSVSSSNAICNASIPPVISLHTISSAAKSRNPLHQQQSTRPHSRITRSATTSMNTIGGGGRLFEPQLSPIASPGVKRQKRMATQGGGGAKTKKAAPVNKETVGTGTDNGMGTRGTKTPKTKTEIPSTTIMMSASKEMTISLKTIEVVKEGEEGDGHEEEEEEEEEVGEGDEDVEEESVTKQLNYSMEETDDTVATSPSRSEPIDLKPIEPFSTSSSITSDASSSSIPSSSSSSTSISSSFIDPETGLTLSELRMDYDNRVRDLNEQILEMNVTHNKRVEELEKQILNQCEQIRLFDLEIGNRQKKEKEIQFKLNEKEMNEQKMIKQIQLMEIQIKQLQLRCQQQQQQQYQTIQQSPPPPAVTMIQSPAVPITSSSSSSSSSSSIALSTTSTPLIAASSLKRTLSASTPPFGTSSHVIGFSSSSSSSSSSSLSSVSSTDTGFVDADQFNFGTSPDEESSEESTEKVERVEEEKAQKPQQLTVPINKLVLTFSPGLKNRRNSICFSPIKKRSQIPVSQDRRMTMLPIQTRSNAAAVAAAAKQAQFQQQQQSQTSCSTPAESTDADADSSSSVAFHRRSSRRFTMSSTIAGHSNHVEEEIMPTVVRMDLKQKMSETQLKQWVREQMKLGTSGGTKGSTVNEGIIMGLKVQMDMISGKCIGYVQMKDSEQAIKLMNGAVKQGMKAAVVLAIPRS